MDLVENKKYRFSVKGSESVSSGKPRFIIEVNGYECSVKMFDFQKGKDKPTVLDCIFKGYNESREPLFIQDVAPLLKQLYQVGGTYDFRVKSDHSSIGYYEVVDKNGFIVRLTKFGKNKIYVNQSIKAKVSSIEQNRVELELVTTKKQEGILLLSPEQLVGLDSVNVIDKRLTLFLLLRLPLFMEARNQYENGNALWVITAIDALDKHLADWLNSDLKHKRRLLLSYYSICVNLLEKSDFLKGSTEEERIEYQKRISLALTHAEDYLHALKLLKEERNQMYIDENLASLKNSGYLYQPEKKMRVIMCLFTLRQESVQGYIQDIFDIITDGRQNKRFMNLFSNAFIEMLDIYIWNESKHVNLVSSIYDDVTRHQVEEMTEALAIQLLLVQDIDYQDWAICHSMLYRFASMIVGLYAENLLQKSYFALFNKEKRALEYSWDDLKSMESLCSKLAMSSSVNGFDEEMSYHGNNSSLTLNAHSIRVNPIEKGTQMRKAYPENVTPWLDIQFYLNERLDTKIGKNDTSILQYQAMWRELELSLFNVKQNVVQRKVRKYVHPEEGDVVMVRITKPVSNSKYDFHCRIEDENIMGEGIINIRQIVRYPVNATMDSFIDRETRLPYLLKTKVLSVDTNGQIQFDMLETIASYLRDSVTYDNEVLAQVTKVTPNYYICISDYGYALSISKKGMVADLVKGDFIWVEIDEVKLNGDISAFFVEKAKEDEVFRVVEVFNSLIRDFAQGKVYEEKIIDTKDEEPILTENYMEKDYLEELIHIIDRYSIVQSKQETAFNYLGVARILALMMNEYGMATYFEKRMDLVKVLQQFCELDKVPDTDLNELLEENRDFISTYPDIKDKLIKLKIINQLDKSWQDDFLWEMANETNNKEISALARLVLSYNMLEGFNSFDQRKAIRKKIYQIMDLNIQIPETSFVAEEDQYTELKSSLIYPAGKNFIPDEKTQIKELMTVVCSFLNAKGGTLYIGVNNLGSATGLEIDFAFLNSGNKNYSPTDVKDKFDLKFRNAVHNMLGTIANNYVTGEFLTVKDKVVYRADILPCPELVYLDGTVFVRQGTSKWAVEKSDLAAFKKMREKQFVK